MKDMLPLSGKLIPEFDRRRSIRDMFSKPSLSKAQSTGSSVVEQENTLIVAQFDEFDGGRSMDRTYESPHIDEMKPASPVQPTRVPTPSNTASPGSTSTGNKRTISDISTNRPLKRAKSGSLGSTSNKPVKGQQSLKGFFKPQAPVLREAVSNVADAKYFTPHGNGSVALLQPAADIMERRKTGDTTQQRLEAASPAPPVASLSVLDGFKSTSTSPQSIGQGTVQDQVDVHDPVESKECWTKLFTKPAAPRCEGHDEPCISLLTKKSGINCGRSFWMCPRPLGPTGAKEKNTQWRCQTFIWCSDWNGGDT